jgi:hypothetical protein
VRPHGTMITLSPDTYSSAIDQPCCNFIAVLHATRRANWSRKYKL